MKKFLCILLAFCTLLCFASCDTVNPDENVENDLNGDSVEKMKEKDEFTYYVPVKVTVTYSDKKSELSNGVAVDELYSPVPEKISHTDEIFYNEQNLPEKYVLTYEGGHCIIEQFFYDDDNRLIKKTYSNGSRVYYSFEYEYDDFGNVIKETHFQGKSEAYVHEYGYNSNNQLVFESRSSETSDNKDYYVYDENGNVIKHTNTIGARYSSVTENTYDSKGKVIHSHYKNNEGDVIVSDYEYAYDGKGNLIKEVYKQDGKMDVTEYTYDFNGNLIMIVNTKNYGEDYSQRHISEYKYDRYGNTTKYTYRDGKGGGYEYEYEYDEYGNVIKRIYTDSQGKVETVTVEYKKVYIPFELSEEIMEIFDLNYYTRLR